VYTPIIEQRETDMNPRQQIIAVRGSTGEVRFFETHAEAIRFCLRRGDVNELWRIEVSKLYDNYQVVEVGA
jgi:hypothetical protein